MANPFAQFTQPASLDTNPFSKFAEPQLSWSDVPLEAVKNTPSSAGQFVGSIAHAIAHPIDTANNILDVVSGGIETGINKLSPSLGEAIRSYDQKTGGAEAADLARQKAGAVGEHFVNRYGSAEGLKRTLATDPVGAAADAAMVLSGGGAVAARVPGMARVGSGMQTAANAIDPIANTIRAGQAVAASRPVTLMRQGLANQGQAGAAGRMAESLPSVDEFANQVAAGAAPGNIATRRQTLDALGAEMEAAGGDLATATTAAIDRLMREQGISRATATARIRDLNAVHAESPLMMGEYPAVAGSDATMRGARGGMVRPQNADLDALGRVQETPAQGWLDYLANNGNAQSASNVRNAINQRQEALSPAMRNTLEQIGPQIGHRPAEIADSAAMIDAARQAGSAEYRAAYASQTNNHALMAWLPRLLNRYDQMAAARSGEYADAMRRASDQFYLQTPNGRVAMATLQQLQDARGAIRGQMQGYARAGRADLARVIRPLYAQVTRLMEYANPAWGRANRRWADMNFLQTGAELGDAFATKAGPLFREQVAQFHGLAPEAQNIVRIHFLQKLYDKLDSLGDTHSISKLFANDHSRNMIREMFGDQAAVDFTRAVRDQKAAEMSQAMTKNSATHRRGVARSQAETETGLVSAARNANVSGVIKWLTDTVLHITTELRNRPMAEMLTTPMTDTARVAQNIHRMRAQQQRIDRIGQPPAWRPRAMPAVTAISDEDRSQRRRGMGQTQPLMIGAH